MPENGSKERRNMTAMGRVLAALVAATAALFVGHGTSHAGMDNQLTLVDGGGDTLDIDQSSVPCTNPAGGALVVTSPPLFPGVSISANLGNGPGIQEVATFSVDVTGPDGAVAVSNAHGTVTGAAGGVLLRPFARLISKAGDSVTTYGDPWNMN